MTEQELESRTALGHYQHGSQRLLARSLMNTFEMHLKDKHFQSEQYF